VFSVQSSIVQRPDGTFAVLLHREDGSTIFGPVGEFATIEEAKAVGTEILSVGMKLLHDRGIVAYRNGAQN
jgi:hypothetical protein